MKVAMLLLAAGRGSRFGGPVPKAFLTLAGKSLLEHCTERLLAAATCEEIVVIVHPDDIDGHLARVLPGLRRLAPASTRLAIAHGGATRQESMQRGLAAVASEVDLVLVHDAARPLVPVEATRACIAAAAASGAALLAVAAPDTLKRVRDGRVESTLDRAGVWLAQTPQVVRLSLLRRALRHAAHTGFEGTDDVSLVEHLGEPVTVVPGAPSNLKITQPADLALATAMLAAAST